MCLLQQLQQKSTLCMIKQKTGHANHATPLNQHQHNSHYQKNVGVAALEAVVANNLSSSQQSKYCLCDICLQNYQIKQKGQQFLRQSSSMFKIQLAKMKKFYQFLSSVDHKIYFRIQMPDIIFYESGQGRTLYKTKGNAVVMIHLNAEMKKQIPNIFIDSKKMLNQHLNSDGQNNHIKYFESVVPSFKHGLSNDNLDNKPKNYTFHSDEKKNEQNQYFKIHNNPDADIAIIKYKDKQLELVNQKQLRLILKSNSKTANIELIQGYVKPHDRESQFIFSEYLDYRKPQNALMFNRSLIQMKTEIGLISKYSKDFIPIQYLDQYQTMLKQMPEQYCLYETYKMVHYIEINRDVRVKNLNTVWFKDQFNEINFFGVMQFLFQENQKITQDANAVLQLKDVIKTQFTDLQKQLLGAWQNIKNKKMKEYRQKLVVESNQQRKNELQQIKRQSSINHKNKISSSRKYYEK